AQHTGRTEVLFCQVVGRQSRSMVSWQSDQVVENTRFTRRISLEGTDTVIRFLRQLCCIVFGTHQLCTVISRYIFARRFPGIKHLLAEIQRPVKAWAVVVYQ